MPVTTELHSTAQFLPLAQDIHRYGAMYAAEAQHLYGPLYTTARKQKLVQEHRTAVGRLAHLAYGGRQLIGLKGTYFPKPENLMNAVCLRQGCQDLERQGAHLETGTRKLARIGTLHGQRLLVLAQHDGYHHGAIRLIYHKEVTTGNVDVIYHFSYLTEDEHQALRDRLLVKVHKREPLDPAHIHFIRLTVPNFTSL